MDPADSLMSHTQGRRGPVGGPLWRAGGSAPHATRTPHRRITYSLYSAEAKSLKRCVRCLSGPHSMRLSRRTMGSDRLPFVIVLEDRRPRSSCTTSRQRSAHTARIQHAGWLPGLPPPWAGLTTPTNPWPLADTPPPPWAEPQVLRHYIGF